MSTLFSKTPNPQQLLQLPLFSLLSPPSAYSNGPSPYTSSCPNAQLSCHNSSAVVDSCCFNYPGGQFLQTQFWDTSPSIGPKDSWTIHGLWPDHCDGGFDQFCDIDREYSNVSSILSSFDDSAHLLEIMNTYWLANSGSSERLWSHEWNKHGTCISTLDAKCYAEGTEGSSTPHRYILDYFNTTVSLFQTLDTYTTLAKAKILPHPTRTWSLAQIQDPLTYYYGVPVTLRCQHSQLSEIWYHFDILGSIQTGDFIPAAPDGPKSNCPSSGIKYLPKDDPEPPRPTSTTTQNPPMPTTTSSPFTNKGFLHIYVDDTHHGCLIRSGQWYTSGTCATYSVTADIIDPGHEQLFTLSSRAALCSINEAGAFECSKTLPYQTIFSADGDKLLFKNESVFYAEKMPGRFEKVDVYAPDGGGDDHAKGLTDPIEVEIRWARLS